MRLALLPRTILETVPCALYLFIFFFCNNFILEDTGESYTERACLGGRAHLQARPPGWPAAPQERTAGAPCRPVLVLGHVGPEPCQTWKPPA